VPYARAVHELSWLALRLWVASACLLLPAVSLGPATLRSQAHAQSNTDGPEGSAPSSIWRAASKPPPKPRPLAQEPEMRSVREDLHPPVHFEASPYSEKLELTLYQERGVNAVLGPGGNRDVSEFMPLCPLPCDISLRSRTYVFAVTAEQRGAVRVKPALRVHDGDRVMVHYDSRLPMRIAGWVLLLGGTAGGGLLLGSGLHADSPVEPVRVASGAVLMAVSLGLGLWFANVPDRARAWVVR
jgi:hypothetical protein